MVSPWLGSSSGALFSVGPSHGESETLSCTTISEIGWEVSASCYVDLNLGARMKRLNWKEISNLANLLLLSAFRRLAAVSSSASW